MHTTPLRKPPSYWPRAKRYLSEVDPILGQLISRYQGQTLSSKGNAFFSLARAIVGQQISVSAAESIWNRLKTALQNEMLPSTLLALSEADLRSAGLSRQKALYLRELALFFSARRRQTWRGQDDDTVIAELLSIKGIGRWSAEMFLIFHLLRPDVFPIADLGVRKAIERHYFGGVKTPTSTLVNLAERWRPYRTVATWYLWHSIDPIPVTY